MSKLVANISFTVQIIIALAHIIIPAATGWPSLLKILFGDC